MNWIEQAKEIFKIDKPDHFTQFNHCDECYEHDQVLLVFDYDTISLNELGNPGWDPICFASVEGKKYYLPAFIRLILETMDNEFYLEQFLFHMSLEGLENEFYLNCNHAQRDFIASFIQYLIENYADAIEAHASTSEVFNCYEIWSHPVNCDQSMIPIKGR